MAWHGKDDIDELEFLKPAMLTAGAIMLGAESIFFDTSFRNRLFPSAGLDSRIDISGLTNFFWALDICWHLRSTIWRFFEEVHLFLDRLDRCVQSADLL